MACCPLALVTPGELLFRDDGTLALPLAPMCQVDSWPSAVPPLLQLTRFLFPWASDVPQLPLILMELPKETPHLKAQAPPLSADCGRHRSVYLTAHSVRAGFSEAG